MAQFECELRDRRIAWWDDRRRELQRGGDDVPRDHPRARRYGGDGPADDARRCPTPNNTCRAPRALRGRRIGAERRRRSLRRGSWLHGIDLSLIHISEPTRQAEISYA